MKLLLRAMLICAALVVLETGVSATIVSAGLPNNPDLEYNPGNGNVRIFADNSVILVFNLQSAAQFSNPADFTDLDTDVGFVSAFTDDTPSAVGWTSALALANIGFDGPAGGVNTPFADMGNIFPSGLDLAGLTGLLSNKAWGGINAAGGDFDLVVIPEPSSIVLLGLGLVGIAGFRRLRRR